MVYPSIIPVDLQLQDVAISETNEYQTCVCLCTAYDAKPRGSSLSGSGCGSGSGMAKAALSSESFHVVHCDYYYQHPSTSTLFQL